MARKAKKKSKARAARKKTKSTVDTVATQATDTAVRDVLAEDKLPAEFVHEPGPFLLDGPGKTASTIHIASTAFVEKKLMILLNITNGDVICVPERVYSPQGVVLPDLWREEEEYERFGAFVYGFMKNTRFAKLIDEARVARLAASDRALLSTDPPVQWLRCGVRYMDSLREALELPDTWTTLEDVARDLLLELRGEVNHKDPSRGQSWSFEIRLALLDGNPYLRREPETCDDDSQQGKEPNRDVKQEQPPIMPVAVDTPLTMASFRTSVYREVCDAMTEASTNTPENLTRILSQMVGRKFPTAESNRTFAKWLNRTFSKGTRFGIECAGCAADGTPGVVARVLYRTQGESSRFAFRHRKHTHSQFEGTGPSDEERGVIQNLKVIPRTLPLPSASKL